MDNEMNGIDETDIPRMMNELFDSNNEIKEDNHDDQSIDLDNSDNSWIIEHEQLYNIKENYLREPMDSVNAFFVYINRNQYIEKIINDKLTLTISEDKTYSYLPNETLLQIIQTKKIKTPFSKYKLIDVVSYLVDLEPENIQSYSKNENSDANFLHVLSIMDDVHFNNSIYIFHGINAIYFLFEEVELVNHRHTLRSILKPSTATSSATSNTITKKVRMQLTNVESRGTRTSTRNRGSGRGTRANGRKRSIV